jgi:hypothetical protein
MLVLVYLDIVLILTQDSCTVCDERTIGLENCFACTRWYSLVTKLKWMLVLVCLEIMLILTQDSCMVCAECTIGSEILLDAPYGSPR